MAGARLFEATEDPATERRRNAAALTLAGGWLGERAGGYAPPEVIRQETTAKRVLETCGSLSAENRILYDLATNDDHNEPTTDLDPDAAIEQGNWEALYRSAVETLRSEAHVYW
ncbi:MAG: hypothetical protein IH933_15650 [Euryarchaeota archaeon]|nr:hypothetical protein [Euryarchaeota archaeon]